ncbi:hypothetical protein, partial [Vibrio anguillarum]|uniref:hypothetical protein n=1 Tax=Vibrio anguillarum TaxID=55601 RepID=UPI002E1919FA
RDCQRVAVFVQIGLCDYGCYFEFSVLRCQPLNRALCLLVFQWLKASSIYVLCPFGSSFELLHFQVVAVGFKFHWL